MRSIARFSLSTGDPDTVSDAPGLPQPATPGSGKCSAGTPVYFTGTIISLSLMFLGITTQEQAKSGIGKPIEWPLSSGRIPALGDAQRPKTAPACRQLSITGSDA